eukprot:TRINITY_DN2437_c0_g1_i1.p1 TRINITY_DN2437_c0_g1~~TRINITY_DN2437_c0_g1_i1.p1  ORF type:complete len:184 (-),score=13.53 TRINITY_DN2437_c0_g1_i1:93-644(-)
MKNLLNSGHDVNSYRALPLVVPGFDKIPSFTKKFITPIPGRKVTHTPLHVAIERVQVESVKLLLEHGADPNLKILEGDRETAFQQALRKRDYYINKALEEWQAKRAEVAQLATNLNSSLELSSAPEITEDDEKGLCNICMERKINTVILECGHSSLCVECATPLTSCPICRSQIARVVKIFST